MPNRHSIRLSNYDYSSPGYYFVTICTNDRQSLFGEIVNQKIQLNETGKIVDRIWKTLPKHHSVKLGAFQIMPNHIHGIIQIPPVVVGVLRAKPNSMRAKPNSTKGIACNAPTDKFQYIKPGSLSCIVRSFKSESTKQIRRTGIARNAPTKIIIWQRNYYEHIIRNEKKLDKIRQYIKSNPSIWNRDRNNPDLFQQYQRI